MRFPRRPRETTTLGTVPTVFRPEDRFAVQQIFAFALGSTWDAELSRVRIRRADGPGAGTRAAATSPPAAAAARAGRPVVRLKSSVGYGVGTSRARMVRLPPEAG